VEQEQRVAAYAVIARDDLVLLSRLSPRVTKHELWTLPGGGVDHGEDPRDAVLREIHEETGLQARVGATVRVHNFHQPDAWRRGRRVDAHALRLVYEGWVAPDAPAPQTQEVDGSTIEAAWHPLAAVLDGRVPTTSLVREALVEAEVSRKQRVAAYAVVRRTRPEPAVLLVQSSALGPHPGAWLLPGGGVEHGEDPRDTVVRELAEETGLDVEVGALLDVVSHRFTGTAPSGRREDFHALGLIYEAVAVRDGEPHVREQDGTTAGAAWVTPDRLGDLDLRPWVRQAIGTSERSAAGR